MVRLHIVWWGWCEGEACGLHSDSFCDEEDVGELRSHGQIGRARDSTHINPLFGIYLFSWIITI